MIKWIKQLIGVNVFGLRMKHEVFEDWIKNKARIHQVIRDLRNANFDPEFFKKHEKEIGKKFTAEIV